MHKLYIRSFSKPDISKVLLEVVSLASIDPGVMFHSKTTAHKFVLKTLSIVLPSVIDGSKRMTGFTWTKRKKQTCNDKFQLVCLHVTVQNSE